MGQLFSYLTDPQPCRAPDSQNVTHERWEAPPAFPTTSRTPEVYPDSQIKIKVEVQRDTCNTLTVCWSEIHDHNVRIIVTNLTCTSRHGTYQSPAMDRMYRIPTALTRGHQYEVTVHGMTSQRQGVEKFRAVFTTSELRTLHDMAKPKGRRPRAQQCHVFYRNKPVSYFEKCRRNNNIMAVYIKDNNGDPASIINGQINGLFFATSVDPQTGQPPNWSFFGTKRVSIAATSMLDASAHLYFADFYCNKKAHYVTLVLTKPGSDTDRFCEKNLIKLDTRHNDFLWRSATDEVFVTRTVWVEVLYTEDVDLCSPLCSFSVVEGRGTSRPAGLPKNPYCARCNLPGFKTPPPKIEFVRYGSDRYHNLTF